MGFKDAMDKMKQGFNEAKLKDIQEHANKRCYSCDHYVDGTKMCKKHNKEIAYSTKEYCINWSDLKAQLKNNMR